jgi:hypothetical protein
MTKSFLSLTFVLTVLVLAACIERKPIKVQDRENPVTAKLAEMVAQEDRMEKSQGLASSSFHNLNRSHRREVYRLLAQAVISDPEDLYRAALILSRADSEASAEACLMAHHLAETAVAEGSEHSRRLIARALDRYLVLSGSTQLYGTQYYSDSGGVLQMYPVDPIITDSIRATLDLAPLDSLKARLARGEPL